MENLNAQINLNNQLKAQYTNVLRVRDAIELDYKRCGLFF